ncbi:MAG: hypothetical protein ACOYVG_00355 [Bacteroidota bacterium]
MRISKQCMYVAGVAISLTACTIAKQSAHVIVNNESNEQISMQLVISDQVNGKTKEEINYSLRPGLQHVPVRKFPKGSYAIHVNANNGTVCKKYPLALDTDRWIMITYMQDDSLRLQKKYGYIDTSELKKINGKYAGLNLYVENRRPPNL